MVAVPQVVRMVMPETHVIKVCITEGIPRPGSLPVASVGMARNV